MSKQFLLFVVEGINDHKEIDAILHTPYFRDELAKYEPRFIEKHGDVTTAKGTTAQNIQQKLNELVLNFRKNDGPYRNIKVQDIHEIVHIVDLDGVFIPSSSIVRGNTSDFIYTATEIITSNVDGARGRNRKKAETLQKLITVNQIGNIPYSIYFVSRNMEHVLFNNSDVLSNYEKRACADQFRNSLSKDPKVLEKSIFMEGVRADTTYNESWEIVQSGHMSLSRCTNFNLFFSDKAKNNR